MNSNYIFLAKLSQAVELVERDQCHFFTKLRVVDQGRDFERRDIHQGRDFERLQRDPGELCIANSTAIPSYFVASADVDWNSRFSKVL